MKLKLAAKLNQDYTIENFLLCKSFYFPGQVMIGLIHMMIARIDSWHSIYKKFEAAMVILNYIKPKFYQKLVLLSLVKRMCSLLEDLKRNLKS